MQIQVLRKGMNALPAQAARHVALLEAAKLALLAAVREGSRSEGYGTAVDAATDILGAVHDRPPSMFVDDKMTKLSWVPDLFAPVMVVPDPLGAATYAAALATARWQLDRLGRIVGLVSEGHAAPTPA